MYLFNKKPAQRLFVLILISILCILPGCTGDPTPKNILKNANKAYFTDKEYPVAIQLYKQILDWPNDSEVQPTRAEREAASLYLIRCDILTKEIEKAMEDLKWVIKISKEKFTIKFYNAVCAGLMDAHAPSETMDVLNMASDQYPKDKFPEEAAMFKIVINDLKKMDLSDTLKNKLSQLAYLN